jgi:hypothetical protein
MTRNDRPGDSPPPGRTTAADPPRSNLQRMHPPQERLLRDEEADLVICHLCGRGFRSLGSHLRAHDLTADQYRQQYGLLRRRALSSRELSQDRSRAQRRAYAASERMRADFAQGQAMARTGTLSRRSRAAFTEHGVSPELERERLERLAAGRRTQQADAERHLAATLEARGFSSAEEALRTLYVERELSVEDTAAQLSVNPKRIRQLLAHYAIPIRATGQNTTAGRRARIALNDQRTAERLGTSDITSWLRTRRTEGLTLRELAAITGRSIPWITTRLQRTS